MAIFTGSGTALITPFHEDGSVNYSKLEELIEDQIRHQTDALIICGTTGEASTLTHEEHLDVIAYAVKVVNGRIPVIAGTGSNCTETAIYLSQEAEKSGADGLLIVTPYYNKATQKGLIEHYTMIADSVSLPIIIYNVPTRDLVYILPETVVALAKNVKNIVGIKEATGNLSQVARLMSLADGCIDLYSGNDDQVMPILSLGGKGVISVVANVAPVQVHELCARFFEGEIATATQMQLDMIPLFEALFCEVNPIPVKEAMNLLGWEAGPLRRPLSPMEPHNRERLIQAMKNYGLKLAE